jgi:acetyl-CoA carboxylase biotin carboxyl carrier protein
MNKDTIDSELVRKLATLLDETGLAEMEIQQGEFRIRIAKPSAATPSFVSMAAAVGAPAAAAPVAAAPAVEVAAIGPNTPGAVCSPMVGNVYLASKPGAPPFIKEGDTVREGQTLLIVEAMKVMNPIASPRAGVVKRILVQDAQPVEYNEVLLVIE